MREELVTDLALELDDVHDNVISLPDLMHGRLADLIQAAGGPAGDHELRGELAARTAFRSVAQSWPSRRRLRMRRGPAVVAATTVATMLVATTGLAAASVLPGSAGRAVDGFLGSVGVDITSPSTPAAPPAPDVNSTADLSAPALHPVGTVHVGCTIGGTTSSGAVAGTVESSSCALTAPLPSKSHGTTKSTPASAHRSTPAPAAAPVVHSSGSGSGSHPGQSKTPGTPPTTLPGGGTSRGGNQGVGGGKCKGGSTGTTTTTTTTDPITTTTDPSTTGSGCGHGGHHHGAPGATTPSSTGGTGTTSS